MDPILLLLHEEVLKERFNFFEFPVYLARARARVDGRPPAPPPRWGRGGSPTAFEKSSEKFCDFSAFPRFGVSAFLLADFVSSS